MRIDYSPQLEKFVVSGVPSDLDALRSIPNRKFDKTSGMWVAGLTRANLNYLNRWPGAFTQGARMVADALEKGPVIKKGPLPPNFQFKTTPRPHQLEPLLRMRVCDNYALIMDPGTGKTKILIDDFTARFLENRINLAVVVCPNSIKSNWEDEIGIHGPGKHAVFIYEPTRKKALDKFLRTPAPGALKWVIMAVESFSQGGAWKVLEGILVGFKAGLAIDESSRIKTHDSERTKKILSAGRFASCRRIATGTPISKGLHQAWAQYEFLSPSILDMGYFAFRNHFCVMGGYKMKQVMGTMNQDEFIDLVAPYTFRASKAECLKDLPPKVYQIRRVQPSAEQARLYESLAKTGLVETGDRFLSYSNTLVRDLRLQQISGGFVAYNLDNEPPAPGADLEEYFNSLESAPAEAIPGVNPKIREMMAVVDEAPGKVIIWTRFKPEIYAIREALRAEYGEDSVVEFHGDIDVDARTAARRRFQDDPSCMFFVGQINTGGIGITLTAASTVIYFSNAWSLEDRIQSEDRAHRIGQAHSCVTYVDLVVDAPKPWVDAKVLNALKDGKDYTDAVLREIELATM